MLIEISQPCKPHSQKNITIPTAKTWVTRADRFEFLLGLIRMGWALTPLNGKRPLLKGWNTPERYINSEEKLREALKSSRKINATGNWGVVTGKASGVFVVDIDSDGPESIARWEAEGRVLPRTLTAKNKRHYYYKWPGRWCQTTVSIIAPGIDIKGDGHGQAVIYPSIHPKTGERYKFDSDPFTTEIAEAPAWLLDLIFETEKPAAIPAISPEENARRRQEAAARRKADPFARDRDEEFVLGILDRECDKLAMTPLHEGHDALLRIARTMGGYVGAGRIPRDVVAAALQQTADSRPGASEIGPLAARTITDGLTFGARQPFYPDDNWTARRSKFDLPAGIEASLIAEHELKQSAPDEFAERRRQEDEARFDDWCSGLDERKALQGMPMLPPHSLSDAHLYTEAGCDVQEETLLAALSDDDSLARIFRCSKCKDAPRLCSACHARLSNQPHMCKLRPLGGYCQRGKRTALEHKDRVEGLAVGHSCGTSGCPDCGPLKEANNRIQLLSITRNWEQGENNLFLPCHKDPANSREVKIKNRIACVDVHDVYARGYTDKLRKLHKKKLIWYLSAYAGQGMMKFYIFAVPGFNWKRLHYSPKRKAGHAAFEFKMELLKKEETLRQVSELFHAHGTTIKLQRTDWDICDKKPGSRQGSFNCVNWGPELEAPPRSKPTGNFKAKGELRGSEEVIQRAAEEFRICFESLDIRRFDKSYLYGFSDRLISVTGFRLMDAVGRPIANLKKKNATPEQLARLQGFINAITGKGDDYIEPARDHPPPQKRKAEYAPFLFK